MNDQDKSGLEKFLQQSNLSRPGLGSLFALGSSIWSALATTVFVAGSVGTGSRR
jgi:hypothetical protein